MAFGLLKIAPVPPAPWRGLALVALLCLTAVAPAGAQPLPASWRAHTAPDLRLEFAPEDRLLAGKLWPALIDERKAVMERLRMFPSQPLRVVLAPTREVFQAMVTGVPQRGTLAVYLLGRGVIVLRAPRTDPAGRWDPRRVLRHELVHAVIDLSIGGSVPLWLHEGLAILVAGDLDYLNEAELSLAAVTDRMIPLRMLMVSFPHGHGERTLAYSQAASFVRFLMRREGMGGLMRLLDVVESGMFPSEAFLFVYGGTLYDLEDQWHDELTARFSFLTLITSTSLLGGLGIPLVLVAVFRRQAQKRRKFRQWAAEEQALATLKAPPPVQAPPEFPGKTPPPDGVSEP